MHSIKNKKVIARVSNRMIMTDRIRNLFSVIAIILTSFMISVVFSIGISFSQNYSTYKLRAKGTLAEITLDHPTSNQHNAILGLDYIESVGLSIYAGSATIATEDGQTAEIAMTYFDENEWKEHYQPAISEIHGSYPMEEEEIMLSIKALEYLDIKEPQVWDCVTLNYKIAGQEFTKDFILTGWFRNFSITDIDGSAQVLVSEKFCNKYGLGMEDYGTLSISAPKGKIEATHIRLYNDISLSEEQKFLAIYDTTRSSSDVLIGSMAIIIMLALFIVLSGYLLIYNIMYISISKDIRFYGMLKTLGTTPKQIKSIVRRQLYLLAVVGIPVGLLAGAAVSFAIVPAVMKGMGGTSKNPIMPYDISFHPIIFIGTALFTLLTIAISIRKPAKLAGNVSPIDALRYTEGKERKKRIEKRGTKGNKIFRMAFRNVMRDRKKALVVFVSLFMGCITLLSINSFLGSIDLEKYLERYVPYNFAYSSYAPYSKDRFDMDFVEKIKSMDGVESVETMHAVYALVEFDEEVLEGVLKHDYDQHAAQGTTYENFVKSMYDLSRNEGFYSEQELSYGTWLLAVDDDYVEEYNKTNKNKINFSDFREGKSVLMAGSSGGYLDSMIGKTITIMKDEVSEIYDITIGGLIGSDLLSEAGFMSHLVGAPPVLVVSKDFMEKFSGGDYYINHIYINCSRNQEELLLEKLQQLNRTRLDTTFNFSSRLEEGEGFTSSIATWKVITNGISAILFMVGILNFINVMITGVDSRKRELAVMESIGMTKRQIGRMLSLEGLTYATVITGMLLTIGNIILWFISKNVNAVADYAVFEYPLTLLLLLSIVQYGICFLVPAIVYNTSSKEVLTDRLRTVVS